LKEDLAAASDQEDARRSLTRADSVAYYAHRRYRELRTEEALADYDRALRACEEALRKVQQAEAEG
jgi:hypothetical protein